MFRTVPLSIIRSFSQFSQQWYMCWQLGSRIRTLIPDPARKMSANLYDICHCFVYSEKLLMMDRGTVRNTWSFIPKINLRNWCILLVLLQEFITMHGHLNVNITEFLDLNISIRPLMPTRHA